MTTQTAIPSFQGYSFLNSKIARFIETLKKIQFSGQLVWTNSSNEKKWNFYFHFGHIFYATGGVHPVRRWARALAVYCPELQINITQLQQDLRRISSENPIIDQEYYLFCFWKEQHQLTQEQTDQVIQSIVAEVLFDLSQFQNLTHQIQKIQSTSEPLALVDESRAFAEVQRFWQSLYNYNVDASFLDKAPLIKHVEQLQNWASTERIQALAQLLDGKKTLRDLAIQVGQNVEQVAHTLLPYIQSGLIELISIPDLAAPVYQGVPKQKTEQNTAKPLIVCVDDSATVCWTMEQILTEAGYQFIGINDGLRAITTLLSCKPDLIFLDVFMPNTNGYEICRNLRKAPSFRNTPIVFLTGLDGVVDQVRARLAGASAFLSKPIDVERVLDTVAKYLAQGITIP